MPKDIEKDWKKAFIYKKNIKSTFLSQNEKMRDNKSKQEKRREKQRQRNMITVACEFGKT